MGTNIDRIQSALRERGFDAWLFYDHHHRDPIAYRVLGLPPALHVTRRWFYLVPAHGEPQKLVHRIESGHLDSLPGARHVYSSWQELAARLESIVKPLPSVAMQYSPENAIPYIGLVDAGTVEMIRGFGTEVVTSADLVSLFEAVLTEDQIESHLAAGRIVDRILEEAWREIGRRVAAGTADEYGIRRWIREAFARERIVAEDGPIVGVNAHSGDPHYEPSAERSSPIARGDFVLIDLWGRLDEPDACFYDITWTGVIGDAPSDRQQEVFRTVRDARDLGVRTVQEAVAARRPIAGWQVDDAVRGLIAQAGFGPYFIHRTGHSIGSAIHGNGANIDNLETRDERAILPNTCFSIEPGIYLPEFGVRSEVDVLVRDGRAEVSGRRQEELVRIPA